MHLLIEAEFLSRPRKKGGPEKILSKLINVKFRSLILSAQLTAWLMEIPFHDT